MLVRPSSFGKAEVTSVACPDTHYCPFSAEKNGPITSVVVSAHHTSSL